MAASMENDRWLWLAVIVQARDDVADLPITDPHFDAAVAFLIGQSPYWRDARDEVCAHIGIHPDMLRRAGLAWVAARNPPPRPAPGQAKPVQRIAPPTRVMPELPRYLADMLAASARYRAERAARTLLKRNTIKRVA
jgi:hypothetical protein